MGAPLPFSRGSRAHSIKARAQKECLASAPEPPASSAPPAAPIPVGKRGAARLRLSIPGTLVSRYATHRCIVIDVSCTGAQVGLEEPMELRETAILQIGDVEPFCEVVRTVRRQNGGINGVRFDPPIENDDVLKIRAYAENYEREEMQALRAEVRKWVDGIG
ncbi:PilZ domain-containing protein [Erythrobacter sp. SCSIO 43205]|uniref:PilZ domain-containing protein n=1 Tax=Erythrobacter sp. SCSIO 43205 TaxID=2779361 RepID=UPI001CAA3613|nr:PilZ domain-containing protein [Erythrobacter sp. SCSIO 43205]UAB77899.1 PilZ domain-containing protein [Erythrobacter sp. SCSIO 43205]